MQTAPLLPILAQEAAPAPKTQEPGVKSASGEFAKAMDMAKQVADKPSPKETPENNDTPMDDAAEQELPAEQTEATPVVTIVPLGMVPVSTLPQPADAAVVTAQGSGPVVVTPLGAAENAVPAGFLPGQLTGQPVFPVNTEQPVTTPAVPATTTPVATATAVEASGFAGVTVTRKENPVQLLNQLSPAPVRITPLAANPSAETAVTPAQTGPMPQATVIVPVITPKQPAETPPLLKVFSQEPANGKGETPLAALAKQGELTSAVPDVSLPEITVASPVNNPVNSQTNLVDPGQGTVTPQPSRENVVFQILEKVRLMTSGNMSEMHIKLKPEHLGDLHLQVTVDQGIVTAKFHTESQQVKQIIETSLPQLKQQLADQGLKVDQVSVYIGQHPDFSDLPQQMPQNQRNKTQTRTVAAIDGEYTESAVAAAVAKLYGGDTVVDYRA